MGLSGFVVPAAFDETRMDELFQEITALDREDKGEEASEDRIDGDEASEDRIDGDEAKGEGEGDRVDKDKGQITDADTPDRDEAIHALTGLRA